LEKHLRSYPHYITNLKKINKSGIPAAVLAIKNQNAV